MRRAPGRLDDMWRVKFSCDSHIFTVTLLKVDVSKTKETFYSKLECTQRISWMNAYSYVSWHQSYKILIKIITFCKSTLWSLGKLMNVLWNAFENVFDNNIFKYVFDNINIKNLFHRKCIHISSLNLIDHKQTVIRSICLASIYRHTHDHVS